MAKKKMKILKYPFSQKLLILHKLDGVGPVDNTVIITDPPPMSFDAFSQKKKEKKLHMTHDMRHVWGDENSQNFSSLALTVCDL